MGFTLRAALDLLPPDARVVVVDLNPVVVDWCRGPLAALTGDALADRRVTVRVDDVARVIAGSDPGAWDAIVLDLYEGPHQATNRPGDPLYGTRALERSRPTLRPGGVLAIWSEEPDRPSSIGWRRRASGWSGTARGAADGRTWCTWGGPNRSERNRPGKTSADARPTSADVLKRAAPPDASSVSGVCAGGICPERRHGGCLGGPPDGGLHDENILVRFAALGLVSATACAGDGGDLACNPRSRKARWSWPARR